MLVFFGLVILIISIITWKVEEKSSRWRWTDSHPARANKKLYATSRIQILHLHVMFNSNLDCGPRIVLSWMNDHTNLFWEYYFRMLTKLIYNIYIFCEINNTCWKISTWATLFWLNNIVPRKIKFSLQLFGAVVRSIRIVEYLGTSMIELGIFKVGKKNMNLFYSWDQRTGILY